MVAIHRGSGEFEGIPRKPGSASSKIQPPVVKPAGGMGQECVPRYDFDRLLSETRGLEVIEDPFERGTAAKVFSDTILTSRLNKDSPHYSGCFRTDARGEPIPKTVQEAKEKRLEVSDYTALPVHIISRDVSFGFILNHRRMAVEGAYLMHPRSLDLMSPDFGFEAYYEVYDPASLKGLEMGRVFLDAVRDYDQKCREGRHGSKKRAGIKNLPGLKTALK